MNDASPPVEQDAIIRSITETLPGVEVVRPDEGPGAGDTYFFYDPQRNTDPARWLPFATIVTKDYEGFDTASRLHRPDVFRLNSSVSSARFRSLFGYPPCEFGDRGAGIDFAVLDRLLPHPSYARQGWVCALNLSRRHSRWSTSHCWPRRTPSPPPATPAAAPRPSEPVHRGRCGRTLA